MDSPLRANLLCRWHTGRPKAANRCYPAQQRASAGGSGKIHICDWKKATRTAILNTGADISGYVQHLAVSPDGRYVVAIGGPIGKSILIFDRESKKTPAPAEKKDDGKKD